MFNRYWRDYPWFLQVILFGLMVFTFFWFSVLVGYMLIPALTGFSFRQVVVAGADSSRSLINASMVVQALTTIGLFLLPPVLFANLSHPSIAKYLSLKKPGKSIHWLLVITLWLGALPVFLELGNLMKMIDLGAGANEAQSKLDKLTKAFLDMKTPADLVRTMVVLAFLPAIGEELFFRGILLRLFYQKNHKIIFSGFIVSVLFALAHGAPYNYLPIFIAGALLAFTFYLTGSLLCSIVAHCLYNGSQIMLTYMGNSNASLKLAFEQDHLPPYITIVGLVLFAGSLLLLWKNRTPLQPNWADNFTPQELEEKAQDASHL